ncbi:hypothetical protein D3C80_1234280 [compost metagenome]
MRDSLRTAQSAAENDTQQGRIPHPKIGGVRLTHGKKFSDLLCREGPPPGKPAAPQVTHRADVLEALNVHQLQHPGFLRHALQRREVGVDRRRGPAGVAQQFGDSHHMMPSQAAPAAGLEGNGAEHAGDNVQERRHGLPAPGGIKGEQVGACRADRQLAVSQRRQKIVFRGKARWG